MLKTENRAALIAVSPALFLLIAEGLLWVLSAATRWEGWIVFGLFGLGGGILAAIIAVPLILVGGTRDRVMWSVVSVCLSALGIFFGLIFWLEALTVGCGNRCFD
jgi:hypothetical protein